MLSVVLGSTVGTDGCFFCEVPERGGVMTHLIGPMRDERPSVVVICASHHNALRAELYKIGERRDI